MSFKLLDSGWSDELDAGMRERPETVLIVCPFIKKRTVSRLISEHRPRDLRVITRFDLNAFNAGLEARFPPVGKLTTPWRWENAGCSNFGKWLLWVREALKTGTPIDLRAAPNEVSWVQISGADDVQALTRAAYTASPVSSGGGALIVCDSRQPRRHRDIASRVRGAVVVENADLSDFIRFAEDFNFGAATAADRLIDFAGSALTGVGAAQLKQRLATLLAGRSQKTPTDAENAAAAFARNPGPKSALDRLVEINKQSGVSQLRPTILRACIQALNACGSPEQFHEMAIRARTVASAGRFCSTSRGWQHIVAERPRSGCFHCTGHRRP